MAGEDGVRDDDAQRPPGLPQPGDAHPGVPGPAPIIDLGGDAVPVRPVKPLGPRRLARLQRELAERSRELAEAGAPDSAREGADPELLEKQRRFAELAAQAAAANEQGPAPGQGPGRQPAAPAAPGTEQPAEVERITVVFPEDPVAGTDAHDPVHVDPALFVSRLSPEDLAGLTHIDVLSAEPSEPSEPVEGRRPPGSHPVPAAVEPAGEPAEEPVEASTEAPAVEPAGDPGGPALAAPLAGGPGAPNPQAAAPADEDLPPPGRPVPAVAAEGLELLEPREYRRRSGNRWLVLLLLALVAALVVVLVLFVL
jgi:hypothetical protein